MLAHAGGPCSEAFQPFSALFGYVELWGLKFSAFSAFPAFSAFFSLFSLFGRVKVEICDFDPQTELVGHKKAEKAEKAEQRFEKFQTRRTNH